MKRIFSFFLGLAIAATALAQPGPRETARGFMMKGDFNNAILVLNKALESDRENLELSKDLALAYTYDKNFTKALNVVKPLVERDDADEATFQVAGNVYRALALYKDGEKMFRKGLKKYPNSGPLHSEFGELLWENKDYDAVKYWEKGIEVAPNYAGNYYNAASYYYFTKDKIWTLIYGEIFVNMEYLTERATEMKRMLLSTYKEKLFTEKLSSKEAASMSDFATAVYRAYNRQSNLLMQGVTIESLNMIRTRFILDWFNSDAKKFPFRLFEYQQQLIKSGMFEAYNQWLFGPVDNLAAYDQWTKANADAYNKFRTFQEGRVFKMPEGQHYAKK